VKALDQDIVAAQTSTLEEPPMMMWDLDQ